MAQWINNITQTYADTDALHRHRHISLPKVSSRGTKVWQLLVKARACLGEPQQALTELVPHLLQHAGVKVLVLHTQSHSAS